MATVRSGEAAVSSVVGTILMLGITVTVFAGVSLVVLAYFQGEETPPRTDIGLVEQGESYLLVNRGGESLPLGTIVSYNLNGTQHSKTLQQLGFSAPWNPGVSICIRGQDASCLSNPTSDPQYARNVVLGSFVAVNNALIASEGVVASATGSSSSSSAAPTVDLTITVLTVSPTSPGVGQSTTFTATLRNGGSTATLVAPQVQFRVDGVVLGATKTAPAVLAAGATVQLTSDAWIAVGASSHTATATADPAGLIAETSEANNALTVSFTVASGTADPGAPFIDTNGDGLYTPGTDTLVPTAQVTDCVYDAGSQGLVIPPSVGTISAAACDYDGAKNVVIGVSLTSTSGSIDITGADITIRSGVTLNSQTNLYIVPGEDFVGDGATFLAKGTLIIGSTSPGQLGVTASLVGATLDNTQGSGQLQIRVKSGGIDLRNAQLDSKGQIDIGGANGGNQASSVILSGANLDNRLGSSAIVLHDISGAITGTGASTILQSKGAIEFTATGAIDVSQATFDNDEGSSQVRLEGSGITATSTLVSSRGQIEFVTTGVVSAANANLNNAQGSASILIKSSPTTIVLTGATLTSKGTIDIVAGSGGLSMANAILDNDDGSDKIDLHSATTALLTSTTLSSKGLIEVTSGTTLSAVDANWDNYIGGNTFTVDAGTALDLTNAKLRSKNTMILDGIGVTLTGACASTAGDNKDILVNANGGALVANGPTVPAGCVSGSGLVAGGHLALYGTGSVTANSNTLTAGSGKDVVLGQATYCGTGSATSITATNTKFTAGASLCVKTTGAIDLSGSCATTQGTGDLILHSGTSALTATGPSTPSGCSGFATTQSSIAITGGAVTLTSGRFTTGGSGKTLTVIASSGTLSAAGVTATTSGAQVWRNNFASGGINLANVGSTYASLNAGSSTLQACLRTNAGSQGQLNIGTTSTLSATMVDANNKMAVKFGASGNECNTSGGNTSTYVANFSGVTSKLEA